MFFYLIFILSYSHFFSNTYIFQQELGNMYVVFARSHMKRCPAFEVNKCYSTDRWVFTGQELYNRHRSLFTRHVECSHLICSLLNTYNIKIIWKVTVQHRKTLLLDGVFLFTLKFIMLLSQKKTPFARNEILLVAVFTGGNWRTALWQFAIVFIKSPLVKIWSNWSDNLLLISTDIYFFMHSK